MRELGETHVFFETMLSQVLENRLWPPKEVHSQLSNLSKIDGDMIGSSFAIALASNLTYQAAVDEWILRYQALQEFDQDYEFFRPMMEVIGKRLLGKVAWGLKLRVFLGASLSVIDFVSDVVVIAGYFAEEDKSSESLGFAMLGFVTLSILLQMLLVTVQHRNNSADLALNILFVITGLKPGWDAYRVAS
jgi:hypothetical protein